jgi:hypothetical protein
MVESFAAGCYAMSFQDEMSSCRVSEKVYFSIFSNIFQKTLVCVLCVPTFQLIEFTKNVKQSEKLLWNWFDKIVIIRSIFPDRSDSPARRRQCD